MPWVLLSLYQRPGSLKVLHSNCFILQCTFQWGGGVYFYWGHFSSLEVIPECSYHHCGHFCLHFPHLWFTFEAPISLYLLIFRYITSDFWFLPWYPFGWSIRAVLLEERVLLWLYYFPRSSVESPIWKSLRLILRRYSCGQCQLLGYAVQ